MESLAQEGGGNVFATDTVLAHLMASARSSSAWDIVVTVLPGGIIFLGALPDGSFGRVAAAAVALSRGVLPPAESSLLR